MLFTKNVFQLTPLITTTLGVQFSPAPGPTLGGFEDFADELLVSEIKCKRNSRVTACSNLNSNTGRSDMSNLFGGFASHTATGSIDFIFDSSRGVSVQYSRGMKVRTSCGVNLLLNGKVISSVPEGVLHLDSKTPMDRPMTSARLAVRSGDVLTIREMGFCSFVLKSIEVWPLTEGYDWSKKTSYFNLTGQPVFASGQHPTYGLKKAVDGSVSTFFTSNNGKIKERAWFKVTIPAIVPGNNIVGFQIHNRPDCCWERLVNVDVYVLNEETDEEIYCGMIGAEGFGQVIDFKFNGDCLAPRGSQVLKLLAPMNWNKATRSILSFAEIKLMYQEV